MYLVEKAKSPSFNAFKFSDSVTKTMTAAEWWKSHSSVLDSDVKSALQQLLSAVAYECFPLMDLSIQS